MSSFGLNTRSKTRFFKKEATFILSCEVRPGPLSRLRYSFICRQYRVAASHKHQNFSLYFAGFEGMYCLKLQPHRKYTNVSSTVTYSLGIYCLNSRCSHISHTTP